MSTIFEENKSLNVEDASQLSMLAYELQVYGAITDRGQALQRLQSSHARQIGEVLLNGTLSTADDRIRRAAEYFLEWARTTSRKSVELSRRLNKD